MYLHTTVQLGYAPCSNTGGGGQGNPDTTLNGSQIAISGGNNIDIGPFLIMIITIS